MATIVTRYLDGASAGGNGTTNALSGVNAAYATFTAWGIAEGKNLVIANELHKLICSGTAPYDWLNTSDGGWVTDIDHFLWLTVEPTSRHNGVLGAGFNITKPRGYATNCLISTDFTVLEWFSAENTAGAGRSIGVYADQCILFGCIGKSAATYSFNLGNNGGATNHVISCLSYGNNSNGFQAGGSQIGFLYNCSAFNNNGSGIQSRSSYGGYLTPINCVAYNNVNPDFSYTNAVANPYGINADYNASQDLTAPGTTVSTGVSAADFTNTALNDYSIAGTTSKLYAAGRSIEPELLALDRVQYSVPRLDLAGNPLTTDIGAFAYVASGGTTFQVAWATMVNRLIGGL